MAQFFDKRLVGAFYPQMLGICTLYVHNGAAEADQAYYRKTREQRLDRPLEEVVAGHEARLPIARTALEPVRQTLTKQPYMGREKPNYANMALLGAFIWIGSVASLPLVAADLSRLQDAA
jgi:hypothetical protein